jgi:Mg-chelatase subunit ChlD
VKQYTDITVILDRSGSMSDIKSAMEEAYNTFIKEHQKVKSTRVSLIQFDTTNDQEVVYQDLPVSEVPKLNLHPRGGTPLVDALAKAIDNTGLRFASMPDNQRPDQVLFVIITDGEENSSRKFTRKDVHDRITHQTNKYKWQFVFLGADQDAIKEAASYGISSFNAIDFRKSWAGVANTTQSLAKVTSAYTMNVNRGESLKGFTADDRTKALDKE